MANPREPSAATWRWYLVALGIAVGAIAGLNAALSVEAPTAPGPAHSSAGVAVDVLVLAVVLAGVVGIGLAVAFLADRRRFYSARRPRIQPQVLLICFLVFLAGNLALSGCLAAAILVLGLDPDSNIGAAATLTGQALALIGAFALGMFALRRITSVTLEDPREIGLRPIGARKAIAWGIGGYCAAVPFAYGSAAIVYWFYEVLFRHAPMPEHPIVPELLKGDAAFAVGMALAVVVAPVVEETFFRGMLYNALRGVMGVWGASLLSAAIFAAVHPTVPAMLLPLLALGVVFAILRESTGSLAPSMICHAVNNAVVLTLARLVYG